MTIKPTTLKLLCTKSGNRCAMPSCRKILVIERTEKDIEFLNALVAHIRGEKPGSARYDTDMSDEERNSYKNLILICPSCHGIIDNQPNSYPVELLIQYKREHEERIIEATKNEVPKITFSELDIVIKHLIKNPISQNDSLMLIPPKEKIEKNGLSVSIEKNIMIGMTQVRQVAEYIRKMTTIDSNFTDGLISRFILEYEHLRNEENERGDDLFNRLFDFSCGGSSDFKQRAAGLSVLVYLFEKCEVFEK